MTDEPSRGPTRPLDPAWMSFDYPTPRDFSNAGVVVVDEQQNLDVVLPAPGPVVVSCDLGSSDRTHFQMVQTLVDKTRAVWDSYLANPPSHEDVKKHTDQIIERWLNDVYGNNRSFYARISFGRVPSKINGRKGTRRAWKRSHPPKKMKVTYVSEGRFKIEPPPRRIEHTVIISTQGVDYVK